MEEQREKERRDERERDEGEERKLRELGEREMSVWDDGREMREEVQLFGCASTAEQGEMRGRDGRGGLGQDEPVPLR